MTLTAREIILSKTTEKDGKKRLSCAQAFKTAAELNISLKETGEICNEEGIKISSCQLGCF